MAALLGSGLEKGILSLSPLFQSPLMVQSALWDFSTHSHENIPGPGCCLSLEDVGRSHGPGECLHGMDKRDKNWGGRSGFGMGAELNPDPCPGATSAPISTSWAPGLGTGLWGAEQFLKLQFGVMGEGLVG